MFTLLTSSSNNNFNKFPPEDSKRAVLRKLGQNNPEVLLTYHKIMDPGSPLFATMCIEIIMKLYPNYHFTEIISCFTSIFAPIV